MMTAQQRTLKASLARRAIQRERKAAQATRALWPTDADQLHSKVERVQQALRTTGHSADAERIALAHRAAWRKQKRLLVQEHGRSPMPYEDGDMTRADWWGRATTLADAAITTARIAEQTLLLANTAGPASATLRLIDAAYFATKDMLDELWEAQGGIPVCDEATELFIRCERTANRLQQERDELATWAKAHDHTITR